MLECEEFIDMIEVYIEDVRKTVGVLDDVQKLRLISELQVIRSPPYPLLRKRREVRKKRSTTSPVPGTSEKNNAPASESDPATQHPPAAVNEETLSAMEDDSSADESSSEANNTKAAGPIRASARVVNADGIGDLTDTEGDDFTVVSRKKKVASIVIDASQNTTGLLTTLSEHLGTTLEGRFENGKLRVFPKQFLSIESSNPISSQKNEVPYF
ncbi:hypothetical protein TNCV_501951 [Trichonephila clavipes]|nr:hypothetical protein TNCV_501951 [Trichonephila clavipes]